MAVVRGGGVLCAASGCVRDPGGGALPWPAAPSPSSPGSATAVTRPWRTSSRTITPTWMWGTSSWSRRGDGHVSGPAQRLAQRVPAFPTAGEGRDAQTRRRRVRPGISCACTWNAWRPGGPQRRGAPTRLNAWDAASSGRPARAIGLWACRSPGGAPGELGSAAGRLRRGAPTRAWLQPDAYGRGNAGAQHGRPVGGPRDRDAVRRRHRAQLAVETKGTTVCWSGSRRQAMSDSGRLSGGQMSYTEASRDMRSWTSSSSARSTSTFSWHAWSVPLSSLTELTGACVRPGPKSRSVPGGTCWPPRKP